jgi:CheY-like chemotaxis protein
MHGGTVQARSEGEGLGTEICIRLPLVAAAVACASSPSETPAVEKTITRRVLVVDDNEAAATLLSAVVKQLGNDVLVAHDGQQAIELAQSFQPEVVLMDLGMPGIDGYAAARHIRQQPWGRDMLLVAVSGWGQDSHKQRAKAAGFDHHLVKPADLAELQRLLLKSPRTPAPEGIVSGTAIGG